MFRAKTNALAITLVLINQSLFTGTVSNTIPSVHSFSFSTFDVSQSFRTFFFCYYFLCLESVFECRPLSKTYWHCFQTSLKFICFFVWRGSSRIRWDIIIAFSTFVLISVYEIYAILGLSLTLFPFFMIFFVSQLCYIDFIMNVKRKRSPSLPSLELENRCV